MFRTSWLLLLALAPLVSGCGVQMGDEGKPPPTSRGSFTVDAEGVEFPELVSWQGWSMTAAPDLLADADGEEVVIYTLQAGAVSADGAYGFGIRLHADSWEALTGDTPVVLAAYDESGADGRKNQVDARIGGVTYISDNGAVTVTSFADDWITGVVETTLVEPSGASPTAATASFEGEIHRSCDFYGEESGGAYEVDTVGVEDARCAALFD